MKKRLLIIFALLLLLLSSCTNNIHEPDISWETIFLQYWNTMNNEYVHFSDDMNYDWDKIYEEYLPLFKKLDYSKKEDSYTAFKYFKEISVNVFDYHYGLTITDGFGNSLSCSPALLKKFENNVPGADIMNFPDIIDSELGYTSVNYHKSAYDKDTIIKYYLSAVPSISEVSSLEKAKGDETYGRFHNKNGSVAADFIAGAYYGDSIAPFSEKELSEITDKTTKEKAEAWNSLLSYMGITSEVSYFYGETKDNVFYIYFSGFKGTFFLFDVLTKDKLTDEEKTELNASPTLSYYRNLIQAFNIPGNETIYPRFKALQGMTNMYMSLCDAVADDEIKGVVVDLRSNGGGELSFLSAIWGAFFPEGEDIQFGYVRYKSGYSRLEYTPWVSISIEGDFGNRKLNKAYDKPVAVLVNGYSVSCSELSCVISKLLENSKIIGCDSTYGATCGLTDRKIYNSGPFSSDHVSIYTTTYQFVDNNKQSFETVGFEPDYKTEFSADKDNAFIAALKWINEDLDIK